MTKQRNIKSPATPPSIETIAGRVLAHFGKNTGHVAIDESIGGLSITKCPTCGVSACKVNLTNGKTVFAHSVFIRSRVVVVVYYCPAPLPKKTFGLEILEDTTGGQGNFTASIS